MKKIILVAFLLSIKFSAEAQNLSFLDSIQNNALTQAQCYFWLEHLCTKIGGRLSGSENAAKAVAYTKNMLDTCGFVTQLQPCKVTHWVRGAKETVTLNIDGNKMALNALSIGNAVGTGKNGVEAEVVEVRDKDDFNANKNSFKGKIVFFNERMDRTLRNTFEAYRKAGWQRGNGASMSAEAGAVAVIVRSLTTELDDYAHTGALRYNPKFPKIAGVCISTNDAEKLSAALRGKKKVRAFIQTNGEMLPDADSHNVIADIKGSEHPEKIILVGGHLDSWDPAQGAHDDGAGSVQSMEVLHIFKRLGYKPKHTIRCVLFMNEENGLGGAEEYAKQAKLNKNEQHILALESDEGGFTPRGFSYDANVSAKKLLNTWTEALKKYELVIKQGGSGADVEQLKDGDKILLMGLSPDASRYFDFHHTSRDTFDGINKRELELGAAATAALIYLADQTME